MFPDFEWSDFRPPLYFSNALMSHDLPPIYKIQHHMTIFVPAPIYKIQHLIFLFDFFPLSEAVPTGFFFFAWTVASKS